MTISDSPAATSVANRYGAPKRAMTKRIKILVWGVVAVLTLIFVLWLTNSQNPGAVTNNLVGFNVVDNTLTTVSLDVSKPASATAQCSVEAQDANFAIVGWDVITVGPNATTFGTANGTTTAHTVQVRTDSSAVTGLVDSCWLVTKK